MTDTEIFLKAQDEYHKTQEPDALVTMYRKLYKCCIVSVAKFCQKENRKLSQNEREDFAYNATLKIYARYIKNPQYTITYLPTVCRLAVVGAMYAPQVKFERNTISYDSLEDFNNKKLREELST